MFVKVFSVFLFFTSPYVNAEIGGFSRANCTPLEVNESVTWQRSVLEEDTFMETSSTHKKLGELDTHTLTDEWRLTWRSYAGHLGDSGTSTAAGIHIWLLKNGDRMTKSSYAADCNLDEWR